jgi:hypothetical protein
LDAKTKTYPDLADLLLPDFVAAVTTGRQPLCPATESLPGMTLIDACYERGELFDYSWYGRIAPAGKE